MSLMHAACTRTDRDLVYRRVGGTELHLDLHLPVDPAGPVPGLVYLHGGGFEVGARTDYEDARAAALAARGLAVASVQYRFSSEAAFPAQLDDARAAVGWLRAHGGDRGVDVDRIGAWGASAGGTLAALLGLGDPRAGAPPDVQASVVWFAPLDLAARMGGSELENELVPPSSERAFLGGPFDAADPRHLAASPIENVSRDAAPFLLVSGDRDRMVEHAQSVRMQDALVRAGARSTLMLVGGAGHEDRAIEEGPSIDLVASFLRAHLS